MFNPGHESGLKDDVSHEIPRLTVTTESDSNGMQEKHKNDTGRSTMHHNPVKILYKLLDMIFHCHTAVLDMIFHYHTANDFRYRSFKSGIQ